MNMTTKITINTMSVLPILLALLMTLASFSDVSAQVYGQQPCPDLSVCTLSCPEGYVQEQGCLKCECRSSICRRVRCSPGRQCTIVQIQDRQYPYHISDMASCETEPPVTTFPPYTAPPPPTTPAQSDNSEYMGSCDFQGRCSATGTCVAKDAVCRKDGLCCRVKAKVDYNIGGNSVSRCLSKPSIGHCRALGLQYVYDEALGSCRNMTYGGCTDSPNSFKTMQDCQNTCELPCQRPPNNPLGDCTVSIRRFYFDQFTESCRAFNLAGCNGQTDNYFRDPGTCETYCKKLKSFGGQDRSQRQTATTTTTTTTTAPPNVVPASRVDAGFGRDSLTRRIINNWRRPFRPENRGNSDYNPNGQVVFRHRSTPGREMRVDADGNVVYYPVTYPPAGTPRTRAPVPDTNGGDVNNNGAPLRRLGDRYRSAQRVIDSFQNGQVNFNNNNNNNNQRQSTPYTPQPYNNNNNNYYGSRSFRRLPPRYSYQNSVNDLRRYMGRR